MLLINLFFNFFVSYKQLNYLNQQLELKVKKSKGCISGLFLLFFLYFSIVLQYFISFHPHPMTRGNPFKVMQIGFSREKALKRSLPGRGRGLWSSLAGGGAHREVGEGRGDGVLPVLLILLLWLTSSRPPGHLSSLKTTSRTRTSASQTNPWNPRLSATWAAPVTCVVSWLRATCNISWSVDALLHILSADRESRVETDRSSHGESADWVLLVNWANYL